MSSQNSLRLSVPEPIRGNVSSIKTRISSILTNRISSSLPALCIFVGTCATTAMDSQMWLQAIWWLQQPLIWRNSARVLWCSFEPSGVSTCLSGEAESSGAVRRQNQRRGDESSGAATSILVRRRVLWCGDAPSGAGTEPLVQRRVLWCDGEEF